MFSSTSTFSPIHSLLSADVSVTSDDGPVLPHHGRFQNSNREGVAGLWSSLQSQEQPDCSHADQRVCPDLSAVPGCRVPGELSLELKKCAVNFTKRLNQQESRLREIIRYTF